MDDDRREALAQLAITVLVPAVLIWAAWRLPDDGLLGVLGYVLACIGILTVFAVPFTVWKVLSPASAARWEANPKSQPVPLAVPVTFWAMTGACVWGLTLVAPDGDTVVIAVLWCIAAATAAFAAAFSHLHLRDRRHRTS
ncbi:hypothetical protein KIN34_13510 [Cellulomonas sp. DKR-3]|uniref:Uncharacterized protein n=1 Tax=Cellulomonas fulva TaxID=2835530 RepID=A0ABS5U1N9_9CELL|nr:hypothetical protein [Cellulomonas fulva]MBT0995302.1 hypothetical protein [Cellulomonas fulva]